VEETKDIFRIFNFIMVLAETSGRKHNRNYHTFFTVSNRHCTFLFIYISLCHLTELSAQIISILVKTISDNASIKFLFSIWMVDNRHSNSKLAIQSSSCIVLTKIQLLVLADSHENVFIKFQGFFPFRKFQAFLQYNHLRLFPLIIADSEAEPCHLW
jgi:hypothetical protein